MRKLYIKKYFNNIITQISILIKQIYQHYSLKGKQSQHQNFQFEMMKHSFILTTSKLKTKKHLLMLT